MFKRITASVLFAILITVGGVGAQTSYAADFCYMDSCVGRNPVDTVCSSDAKTIRAMDYSGEGVLEMRWSRRCNATWTRFTVYWRSSAFNMYAQMRVYPQMHTSGTPYALQGNVQNNWLPIGESYWTRMMTMRAPTVCSHLQLWGQSQGSQGYDQNLGSTKMCIS